MKKKIKFSLIIATIIATLSLSACVVVPNDGATSSMGGRAETYDVTVNVQTATESQYSSLTEMLDDVRPSVVEVYVSSKNTIGTGAGSGIIISKKLIDCGTQDVSDDYTNYYIMTCHHVIDGTDTIVVKDIDGNQFNVSLIGGDPESDIAVLRLSISDNVSSNLAVATIRDIASKTNPLKFGEDVVAIGNPLGTLGGTVTKGIISTISRTVTVENRPMELIQTDCSINSGNSGGGLFDMQGRLVGVVNAGYTGLQGLNFAIPVDDAISIYESLMETYFFESPDNYNYGYVEGRANIKAENATELSFGYDIAFADYSTNMFSYYTYVMQVRAGSVYDNAGFKADDYIVAVSYKGDKRTLQGAASAALINYLNELDVKIGDQITFTVVRNGVQTNLKVTYKQFIYGDTGCTPSV